MKISDAIIEWCDEVDVDGGASDEMRAIADRIDREMAELPKDADGVPIRLKDWVWYVGIDAEITKDDPQQVVGFVSDLGMNGIYAVTRDYPDKAISPKMLKHRAPEPPDSWEKLEEDAKKSTCELAGMDVLDRCRDCVWGPTKTDFDCNEMARLEILKRAKKLAGIEGKMQR